MNENLSFSVFTADIVSLLLLGTLYLSNWQRMNHDRDIRIVARMMAITAVSNVADCCVFYLDGSATRCCGSWCSSAARGSFWKCVDRLYMGRVPINAPEHSLRPRTQKNL